MSNEYEKQFKSLLERLYESMRILEGLREKLQEQREVAATNSKLLELLQIELEEVDKVVRKGNGNSILTRLSLLKAELHHIEHRIELIEDNIKRSKQYKKEEDLEQIKTRTMIIVAVVSGILTAGATILSQLLF